MADLFIIAVTPGAALSLALRSARFAFSAAFSGNASSAAADGVGALMSATKSAMVKSVSWPTAEITGTGQSNIALATHSSLKGHRSSIEPPPLATITTSHLPSLPAFLIASAIRGAASRP